MKGSLRPIAWTAAAVLGMGALWCCRTEVSGGLEQEISDGAGDEVESGGAPLGTNLAVIGYPYRNMPFVDLMRSADPFHSGTLDEWADGRTLELRDDGYPARLAEGQIARSFLIGGDDPHVGGELVVLYEGQGRIEYRGGVEGVERGEGRDVITLRERDGLWLELDETDPNDPLHAIRVLAPGGRCEDDATTACRDDGECSGRCVPFEESYERQPFHPTFLAEHAPFDVLRFMNWMRTNRVRGDESPRPRWPVRDWDDYPGVGYVHWYPVPVDLMVDLANTTDASPWFNMPHRASDAFVRRFAERVKERLDPELSVYVEYSNEAWNDLFLQSQEINALGCEALSDDPAGECDHDDDGTLCEYSDWNDTQERCADYGQRWFGRRTAEIGAIWDEVFGDDPRVVTVLATQIGSLEYRGPMLEEPVPGLGPVHEHVDAVAVAPYFGGGEPPASVDAAFERAELPGGDETYAVLVGEEPDGGPLQWILRDLHALRPHDLPLLAYEGGQHFLSIGDREKGEEILAINRDPRMGELYDEYLRRWRALTGGSLFVHYRSPSAWSEWGCWGSKEYQGQPLDEAPKHQALLRYLAP
jgi:hypothetical protein